MRCGIMAGMKKLMIIGGGAAGLAAAVAATDALRAHGVRVGADGGADAVEVTVCEADERVGRSILATGNGRCNFSNVRVDAGLYRNAEFVGAALAQLRAQGGHADGWTGRRRADAACAAASGPIRCTRSSQAWGSCGAKRAKAVCTRWRTRLPACWTCCARARGTRALASCAAARRCASIRPRAGRPLPRALRRRCGAACRGGHRGGRREHGPRACCRGPRLGAAPGAGAAAHRLPPGEGAQQHPRALRDLAHVARRRCQGARGGRGAVPRLRRVGHRGVQPVAVRRGGRHAAHRPAAADGRADARAAAARAPIAPVRARWRGHGRRRAARHDAAGGGARRAERRPGCAPKGRSGSAMPRRSRQRSKDSRSRSEASASRGSARCGAADSRWRRSIRARARRARCRACTWWARRWTWTRPAAATTCIGRGLAACWRVALPPSA